MPSIPQYLIESSICLLVFYVYYRLVLQGRGSFLWSRIYLLLTPALSLVIPGLSLDFLLNSQTTAYSEATAVHSSFAEKMMSAGIDYQFNLMHLFMLVYLMGVSLIGFRFMDKFWHLVQEFRVKRRLVQFSDWDIHAPFPKLSFFSYAFWNNVSLVEYEGYKQDFPLFTINEKHGTDVVFTELLVALSWFNPLMYLYRREMKELHENNYLYQQAKVAGIFKEDFKDLPQSDTRSDYFENKNTAQLTSKEYWIKSFLYGASISLTLTLISLFSFNLISETPLHEPLQASYLFLQKSADYTLFSKEKETTGNHKIRWADKEIKLEKIAAPNGYTGEMEVSLDEFNRLLNERIQVFSGQEEQKFETMDIQMEVLDEKGKLWFPNVENGSIKLVNKQFGNVQNRIMQGDVMNFSGKAGDIYLTEISVKIKDPLEMYRPQINVNPIAKSAPVYGFQIVNLKNKKALIKIDTSNITTRHILDIYANNSLFQVIHIPDFKTNVRFLDANEGLFGNTTLKENYLSVARFNRHFLPEYQAYQNQMVQLNWGEMSASPSSENYITADFRKNFTKRLKLFIGDEKMDIQSFRLIVKPKNEEPVAYHTDKINERTLRRLLRKIPPETSLYFDEIILKKSGQFYYLPISFVFNIGKDSDKFSLKVSASAPDTPKSSQRKQNYLEFRHYPLSELIAVLAGNERMEFDNKDQEPIVDVEFESAYLSARQGEKLLLKRLYQQFFFASNIRFEHRKVWIIKPVENTAKMDTLEMVQYIQPQMDSVVVRNRAQGLETLSPGFMDDLVNTIERTFGELVFNESGLTNAYGLALNLSSFEALRAQLEQDYGLIMEQESRVVKIVNIKEGD